MYGADVTISTCTLCSCKRSYRLCNKAYSKALPVVTCLEVFAISLEKQRGVLFDLLGYCLSDNLGHLRRNGIAHHLIARRNIVIFEDKVIGEGLDTSTFADAKTAILIFVSWDKDALVWLNKLHLRSSRMQGCMACTSLNSEGDFIPSTYTIARHKHSRKTSSHILVIGYDTGSHLSFQPRSTRHSRIFEIIYSIS